MRVAPLPSRVILPPPSMTIFGPLSLKILAGWLKAMVAGLGPQLNVMMPPLATAATKSAPEQLSGVPLPMTVVGDDTSSSEASAGMAHLPSGLPGAPDGGVTPPTSTAPASKAPPLPD